MQNSTEQIMIKLITPQEKERLLARNWKIASGSSILLATVVGTLFYWLLHTADVDTDNPKYPGWFQSNAPFHGPLFAFICFLIVVLSKDGINWALNKKIEAYRVLIPTNDGANTPNEGTPLIIPANSSYQLITDNTAMEPAEVAPQEVLGR